MPPQVQHQDTYLASIKKLFIPFVLINIIAIVFGASFVNIFNILDRQQPSNQFSNEENASNTLTEKREIQESGPTNLIAQPPNEHLTDTSLTQSTESNQENVQFTDSVFLPAIGNHKPANLNQAEVSAYPGPPNELQKLEAEHNKPIDFSASSKEEPSNTELAKIPPNNEVASSESQIENNISESQSPLIRRLSLPTVEVTTPIIDIPIVEGNWDISKLDQDAGVLEGFSSHPNDPGALVIAAHATTRWPVAGPFAELRLMGLGDPIVYQVGDTEYIYEISRFLRVDTSNVDVLRKNGEDGIVLVTCGSYNYFTGEYGSRLIAYGNLKETRPINLDPLEQLEEAEFN